MGNAAQTKAPPSEGGGGGGGEAKDETPDPNDAGYVWGELQSQNQELPNNIELRLNTITIGRRKDNTFHISGPLISGHHCVITRQVYEGTDAIEVFHIRDESQNGTFLDGVSIGKGNQKVLRHGATVALPWRVTKDNGETEDKLINFEFVKIEKDVFDEDWNEVLEKYDLGKQLGSGAFAVVKHVTEKSTGEVYAMKVVNKEKMASVESTRDDVLTSEVDLLNKLDHPNILKIHEVIDTKTKMFIFLELVRDGDLYDKLKREGRISEDDAREIFIQMADAIAYLHKENVSHRDLKPENILVQENPTTGAVEIKISDFGLSRTTQTNKAMETMAGTLDYCAPEIINHFHNGNGYGREVDMWSLGVILYIMVSGAAPFGQGSGNDDLLDCITNAKFQYPENRFADVSDACKDLINHLLVADPKTRYTADQSLQHPWIKDP